MSNNGIGKKNVVATKQFFFILNQHGNAKKELKFWKLQLHDRTSYVMKNTLILAVNNCTILYLIIGGGIKCSKGGLSIFHKMGERLF